MMNFEKKAQSGSARAGILKTRRGDIQTPFFLSVATRGAIKAGLSMKDLKECQAPFMLANTYHLHLRPTSELVSTQGGLHAFTGWDGPILTDSGGFQVFSLQRKKITDEGVTFWSHINGDKIYMDAEISIQIQNNLGSDILMAFDECPPNVPKFHKIRRAVERTTAWAKRSLDMHFKTYDQALGPDKRPQIFGIIQGGCFPELRKKSLREITALPFDGFALGGLAVGESEEEMYKVLDQMTSQMPEDKPRYLMGVGTPRNLLEAISRGVDMFDCVMPMRNARHGTVFSHSGQVKITRAEFREDPRVLDDQCTCSVCAEEKYSRAYLHHLFRVKEDLGRRLLTIHNLSFYHQLMSKARAHIVEGDYEIWKDEMIERMTSF